MHDDTPDFQPRAIASAPEPPPAPVGKSKRKSPTPPEVSAWHIRDVFIDAERALFLERCQEFARLSLTNHPQPLRRAFAKVMRRYRNAAGYSQRELALIIGLDRTTVGLYEQSLRTPTLSTFVAMGCALNVPPVRLLCDVLNEMRDRKKRNGLGG